MKPRIVEPFGISVLPDFSFNCIGHSYRMEMSSFPLKLKFTVNSIFILFCRDSRYIFVMCWDASSVMCLGSSGVSGLSTLDPLTQMTQSCPILRPSNNNPGVSPI